MSHHLRRGLLGGIAGGFVAALFGGWSSTVLAVVIGTLLGLFGSSANSDKRGSAVGVDLVPIVISAFLASVMTAAGGLLFDLSLGIAAQLSVHSQGIATEAAILAVVLGTVAAALMAYMQRMPNKARLQRLNLLVFLIFLIALPFIDHEAGLSWLAALIFAEIFVLLALGLNIVVGYAGLLDLGYAAFFAIGAYFAGFLASQKLGIHVNFWILIWLSAGVAALFGLLLGAPTLRLRGDYLAIVTLGFGEIVPVAFQQLIKIVIKEPITCSIIPAIQTILGTPPSPCNLVFVGKDAPFDLTSGVKGISPIDTPILPLISHVEPFGLGMIVKIALMLILMGVVGYVFARAYARGNRSPRRIIGTALLFALIVFIFVPIPHIEVQNLFADSYNSVLNVVQPGAFRSDDPTSWYFLILGLLVLSVFLIRRLKDSRLGRAWMAIREDELAANQMGVNLVRTKLLAFSMGASFSGFAGAFYGAYVSGIFPSVFDFSVSVIVLCTIVLGGLGNISGAIFGSMVIMVTDRLLLPSFQRLLIGLQTHVLIPSTVGDPKLQEFIRANFDPVKYRFLLLGLVLVIVMAVRPEGLLPSRERAEELHAVDKEPEPEVLEELKRETTTA